jgi:hypothetical protein
MSESKHERDAKRAAFENVCGKLPKSKGSKRDDWLTRYGYWCFAWAAARAYTPPTQSSAEIAPEEG